ncbi:glycosyltransferase [Flavihumibacter stibioxidans]|uniref:Glycosyl transferase n=1 Tax=Flavihumibacter stibioxidans TaxID=1834163 RepID=A0ABR7M9M0_9BACT|nr:glycosyltransferase [Flavihumibacter stibioxidans]MBC6491730.1 glycosyl transferase [Flavihumibacter stibioxidans]
MERLITARGEKTPMGKNCRPCISGKFIIVNGQKFYIKGVTYGTFRPDENGQQYPPPDTVEKDFSMMAEMGINAVRTYTVPPLYMLDLASRFGLKLMIGLPWEQHITFLDDKERIAGIMDRVREGVRSCRQHEAILCFAIGNEIPSPIVRWYGPEAIQRFIRRLYQVVKEEDPRALVTYVNYPTTEYLRLDFLDFDCFNVYLETEEKLKRYLFRLHNLSGNRPLVLAEIGLDSLRNGPEKQADVLNWQVRNIFSGGCAGTFVFAWTDEWWRGGLDIEDWDFGLVTRDRQPKPALSAVAKVFAEAPFQGEAELPLISVVVCTYNGSPTIRDTLNGLMTLDYPNFEVIVVSDGSTDGVESIIREYPFRLIVTANRGLSSARNTGMYASQGEIVAYIDDDAYPDPQWLKYLAYAFMHSDHAGIGGPNIAPEGDGSIAACVANAPGGPVHVLTTDEIAEHIPGCNMAFRRSALLEIGGCDPLFRSAGDDVDLCWRIQYSGKTIGFHPGAMVWHHRRNSVKMYWKQQKGYGKAEALLELKWPEKYNNLGHLSWAGHIYGNGLTLPLTFRKDKIFHGTWGAALFQSVYQQASPFVSMVLLMPEWYLVIFFLAMISALSIFWNSLLYAVPLLVASVLPVLFQAGRSAAKAYKDRRFASVSEYLKAWALTTILHMIQPVARLYGRIQHGLTPWRKRCSGKPWLHMILRKSDIQQLWHEKWRSSEDWLTLVEQDLLDKKVRIRRSGQFDEWDLQASCGLFAGGRGMLVIEEHGQGKQMLKFKTWAHLNTFGLVIVSVLLILSVLAYFDRQFITMAIFYAISMLIIVQYIIDAAMAMSELTESFSQLAHLEKERQLAETRELPVIPNVILVNAKQKRNKIFRELEEKTSLTQLVEAGE